METVTSAARPRAWHERGWVRGVCVGAVALGVALLVVGGLGFASARSTNDEAQQTKERVAELKAETSALEAEAAAAHAAADAALAQVDALDDARSSVFDAISDAEDASNQTSDAGNAIAACKQADLDAYVQCTTEGLAGLRAATSALVDATDHLHEELAALGEELE